MNLKIPEIIASSHFELVKIFKLIHKNPELGFEETQTSNLIRNKLQEYGVDHIHTGLGVTGVVGIINGKKDGSGKIGLRVDMDALPITEKTNLPYSSQNLGKMHACGHDGHTTMLLGAAKYLASTRNFRGQAILIFQPAEEGLGGATKMIKDGILKKFPCDEIYGIHNWPNCEPNKVEICVGPAMAGAAFFDIEIIGKGSHAAVPHKSIDSLLIASSLVDQIQYIVSRNIPPFETCVISVTKINAGSAYNVIPEISSMGGTIRYFSDEVFDIAKDRLMKLCSGFEKSYGVTVNVSVKKVFDILVNDKDLSEAYISAAADVVGSDNASVNGSPSTGSEDFADFLKVVPGAYCKLGHSGNISLHSPEYFLDPDSLPVGASILARIIEKRLPI